MNLLIDPIMVFDVESIGLHGEGFAVGFVVIQAGKEVDARRFACTPIEAYGDVDDREWVSANIPPIPVTCDTPISVRDLFWSEWQAWKKKGAILAADCGWPVEARFLCGCIDDESPYRKWEGPYPFLEISSYLLAKGMDPMKKYARYKEELPEHDPLADSRQSARRLWEAITR